MELITLLSNITTVMNIAAANPFLVGLIILIPSIVILTIAKKNGCSNGRFYGFILMLIIAALLLVFSKLLF